MIRRHPYLVSMVLILIFSFSFSGFDTAAQDAESELNILFVLDTSASMDTELKSSDYDDFDRAVEPLIRAGQSSIVPTDPNNVRFDAVLAALDWLQTLQDTAAVSDRVAPDVFVSAVTFDTDATLRQNWSPVSALTLDDSFLSPPVPGREAHSDFIDLYKIVGEAFAGKSRDARNVVFVITDSTPCDPRSSETLDEFSRIRGAGYCSRRFNDNGPDTTFDYYGNHMRLAGDMLPDNLTQYVLHIRPQSDNQWEQLHQDFDAMYRSIVEPRGRFETASSIEAAPGWLLALVTEEYMDQLSAQNPDVSRASLLNVEAITNQQIHVPAYMNSFRLVAQREASAFSLEGSDRPITPAQKDAYGPLVAYTYQNVPAGTYTLTGLVSESTSPGWVAYSPASSTLTMKFSDPNAAFPTIELIYAVSNETGNLWDPTNPLDVDITLKKGNTEYRLQLVPDNNERVYKGTFLHADLERTTYSIGNVQIAPVRGTADYTFLQPPPVASITLDGMGINLVPGDGMDAKYQDRLLASNTLLDDDQRIPSSIDLELALSLRRNGQTLAAPSGLSASLTFEGAPDNTTCPLPKTVPLRLDTTTDIARLTADVELMNEGVCNIYFDVIFTPPIIPPYDTETGATSITMTSHEYYGAFGIKDTQRLDWWPFEGASAPPVSELSPLTISGLDRSIEEVDFFEPRFKNEEFVIQFGLYDTESETLNCLLPTAERPLFDPPVEGMPFEVTLGRSGGGEQVPDDIWETQLNTANNCYQAIIHELQPDQYELTITLPEAIRENLDAERYELADAAKNRPSHIVKLNISSDLLVRAAEIMLPQGTLFLIAAGILLFFYYRWLRRHSPLEGQIGLIKLDMIMRRALRDALSEGADEHTTVKVGNQSITLSSPIPDDLIVWEEQLYGRRNSQTFRDPTLDKDPENLPSLAWIHLTTLGENDYKLNQIFAEFYYVVDEPDLRILYPDRVDRIKTYSNPNAQTLQSERVDYFVYYTPRLDDRPRLHHVLLADTEFAVVAQAHVIPPDDAVAQDDAQDAGDSS